MPVDPEKKPGDADKENNSDKESVQVAFVMS
jgi:hypothetical protein